MPVGPGRYDTFATDVRERTHARGVIVIIVDGNMGSGFSVQAPLDVTVGLPEMLEYMAREIRASLEQGKL